MYRPRLAIASVGSDVDRRIAAADLCDLAECVARIGRRFLDRNPHTPSILRAGVVYRDDSHRVCDRWGCRLVEDDWCDLETVLAQGYGDCDDLVAARLAELWRAGRTAYALARCFDCGPRNCVRCNQPIGNATWHMQILHDDDGVVSIEDICRALGMPEHPDGDAAVVPPELAYVYRPSEP